MKFETAKKATVATLVICLLLCALSLLVTEDGSSARYVMSYGALGFGALGIICLVAFCKCPFCGTRIFRNLMHAKICPNCRRDLVTGVRKKGKGSKR